MTEVANGIWNAVVAVFQDHAGRASSSSGSRPSWQPRGTTHWRRSRNGVGCSRRSVRASRKTPRCKAIVSLWDKAKAAIEERGGLFASIGQGLEDDAILSGIGKAWDKAVAAIQERGGLWQAILQGLRDDPILQELIAEFGGDRRSDRHRVGQRRGVDP